MIKAFLLTAALVFSIPLSCHQRTEDRFSAFVDLLAWSAKESGADNWAQVITTNGFSTNADILEVPFGWDAGIRVGIDYDIGYDQWDTQLSYAWFRTKGTGQASTTTGEIASSFLGNFYINNSSGANFGPSYKSASIKWTILYNVFDLELGRNCRIGKMMSLHPFIGLKGGSINQTISSDWHTPTVPSNFTSATEDLKNNFWGIGPSIGLNTKWTLITLPQSSFYLFGDFSGALLWGHWTFADHYQNNAPEAVTVDVHNINGAASMVRAFMGFEWKGRLSTSCFSIRLGYEAQFWLDQLQFYSFNTGRLDNMLTFQGGVFDLRFDF